MANPTEQASGSIYDLGYRKYEGVRLGRRQAITNLYIQTLRGAFGLGRHHTSKILPFALAAVTVIPAVVYLGLTALVSSYASATDVAEFEMMRAHEYYGLVQWPLALFVAVVAPEAVGRDQRNRTLSLYFSRALLREDYILAKVLSVATAVLILALVPQALLFIGNALVDDSAAGYLRENWKEAGSAIASGALLALFTASVGLSVGSMTSRWPLASGAIIAYFAITLVMGGALANIGGGAAHYSLLGSGFHIMRGSTLWFFGEPGMESEKWIGDVPLGLYALAAFAWITLALVVLRLRYERIPL